MAVVIDDGFDWRISVIAAWFSCLVGSICNAAATVSIAVFSTAIALLPLFVPRASLIVFMTNVCNAIGHWSS